MNIHTVTVMGTWHVDTSDKVAAFCHGNPAVVQTIAAVASTWKFRS